MSDPTVVNEASLIPIGAVCVAIGVLITTTWKLRGILSDILTRLKLIEERSERMEKQFYKTDFVTGHDFDNWIKIFKSANPELKIPDRLR